MVEKSEKFDNFAQDESVLNKKRRINRGINHFSEMNWIRFVARIRSVRVFLLSIFLKNPDCLRAPWMYRRRVSH